MKSFLGLLLTVIIFLMKIQSVYASPNEPLEDSRELQLQDMLVLF